MTAFQFIGRLHPLLVHFPIALIILAGVGEMVRLIWDRAQLGILVFWALGIGALSAIVALTSGWGFAYEYHPQPSLHWMLQTHRWFGVATAVLASTAWVGARVWVDTPSIAARWYRRSIIWLTGAVLVVTAHLGALMVWGSDYFS